MNRRLALFAATALVFIAAFAVIATALFYRATFHVQRRLGPRPSNSTGVTLLARDRTALQAWWFQPRQSNGNCVLVLHGIADSRVGAAGFAPMFLDAGYSVLTPDSRAHGASGGEFVTYGLLEKYDVLDWAAWMKNQGCRQLYALGESLGAAVLIQSAAVQPVFSAIVAECAYADLLDAGADRMSRFAGVPRPLARMMVDAAMLYAHWADGLDLRAVSPLHDIARAPTPILLIHGLNDRRTPPSDSVRLERANPRNSLWLVPGASHTGAYAAAPTEFRRRVLAWFAGHPARVGVSTLWRRPGLRSKTMVRGYRFSAGSICASFRSTGQANSKGRGTRTTADAAGPPD